MRLHITAVVLVTLSLFHTSVVADAVHCAAGAIAMDVSSPAELQNMTDTINCTGQGIFDVTWIGSVRLGHEIELSDTKTLSITGSSSSPVVLQGAEIDAGDTSGIFSVYDGSTLRLNNLVLKGGNAEVGGGIHVHSSSSVYVAGCSFTSNNASTGGKRYTMQVFRVRSAVGRTLDATATGALLMWRAIYANQSEVHIDGETLFLNNSAAHDRGGAIFAQESDIYINGNTSFAENSAAFVGGAICAISTGVQVDGNTSFVNNSADGNAGAIYAEHGQMHVNGNAYFGNNFARFGGALLLHNCSAYFNDQTVFGHNSATRDGGAIYAEDGSQIQVDGQTSFGNNSANNGGAFGVEGSELFLDGSTSFTDNTCFGSGAVIYGSGSEINITGQTNFIRNAAEFDGGIMHVFGSTNVNITGNTVCDQNSAVNSGGGIFTTYATLYLDGDTFFTRNVAGVNGGALYSFQESTIHVGGRTTFIENVAKWRGGAIYGSGVTYRINGTTLFSENFAYDGGAISARESDVLIGGNTTFSSNSASHDGGAINGLGSNIIMDGGLEFSSNTALNGGGIFIFLCRTVHISGRASFGGNSAVLVGGAISITDSVNGSIIGSSFVSNEAESGGAVSLASTLGAAAGFEGCQFDSNTATNGGALHLTSGDADESEKTHFVRDSVFRHNLAYESGGALFNTGPLKINDTVFSANTAKDGGLAIMNAEAPLELWNASFHGNTLTCDPEEYLDFDRDSEDGCRFDVVCQNCLEWEGCQVDPRFSTITSTSVPSCEVVPVGVSRLSTTTLATFDLMPGHYRISADSRDILECYRFDSCTGGTNALNYCDTGYAGPYCAVCADGFTPGVWRRCHECSTKTKRLATGLAASILILLGVLTVWLVPRPLHGRRTGARVRIRQAISSTFKLIVEVFPLSAIKIVVVVLQIVTQFTEIAGAVFPAEYEAFLSKTMPESVDIGVILQNFCIVATDFYHRLLISTLGPLLVLSALSAVSYAMNKSAHNETSAELANPTAQRKLLSAGLFILFLVYSSVSFTIFQTFVCEDLDDGNSYLRADYSITCLTEKHNAYRIYAGVMVFVYPVGIPAFYGCWLARNRRDLKTTERRDAAHLQPFRGLWAAYKPSCYYYEVVECSRRIVLTGAAVFILPNTSDQIAVVLILSVLFMFVSESLSPFKLKHDMWLYRWGNGIILGSMYVAFLMKVELTGEDSRTAFAMSALLIAANAFMVATILVHAGLLVYRIYLSRRRTQVYRAPSAVFSAPS